MLVAVSFLYYALRSASRALPILAGAEELHDLLTRDVLASASTNSTMTDGMATAAACVCPGDQRSVFDIIWSCLAVIFTCTFVTIHPNVPHPEATEFQIMRNRAHLMCWALIAPELLVIWAMRQWYGTRQLSKRIIVPGWTKTHSYFVQMGGFMLMANDQCLGVIDPRNLLMYFDKGYMYFEDRKITKEEISFTLPREEDIKDKGKGDGLSKALVVGQTFWFIAQCLSRWQQKLIVTELELVTLAFAALNGAIYFLWWKKPLDAKCAIPIIWNRPEESISDDRSSDNEKNQSMLHCWIGRAVCLNPDNHYSILSIAKVYETVLQRAVAIHEEPNLMKRVSRICEKCFTSIRALGHLSTWHRIPLRILELRKVYVYKPMSFTEMEVSPLSAYLPSYNNMDTSFSIMMATSAIAVGFGGIHLIAWNFKFPTPAERWVWRGGSFLITAMPLLLLVRSILRYRNFQTANQTFKRKERTIITFWVMVAMCPFYAMARIVLIVEAFVALRNLTPGATAEVEWSKFLPHI